MSQTCNAGTRDVTFFTSPDGNDDWSGRLEQPNVRRTDGPLASLTAARDSIRQLKADKALTTPIRVVVGEGTYTLTRPLVLTHEDSGTARCPIRYEAQAGTRPVFTGGRVITGFTVGTNGVWTTFLPQVKAGAWYFEQLFVNGRRAVRARHPNRFYFYMAAKADQGIDPTTGQSADLSKRAFVARAEDIASLAQLSGNQLSDVTLVAYHAWEVSRHRIASVDFENNTVVTTETRRGHS